MKVRCKACKNEQIIFGRATSVVRCLVCGNILAVPTGGKCKIISARLKKVIPNDDDAS